MKKITTLEMEVELSKFLNHRMNLVIPNVSWGMFGHECDLIKLTPSGFCSEIEIKISLSDLKKDNEKKHNHIDSGAPYEVHTNGNKIKYLYFAIPEYLEQHIEHIPERAGILILREKKNFYKEKYLKFFQIRAPKKQSNYRFSEKERIKLLSLMAMRIWRLKQKLAKK